MRKHYDFSQARPNPYARRLKRPVTIRLDQPTIAYFKPGSQPQGVVGFRPLDQLEQAFGLAALAAAPKA